MADYQLIASTFEGAGAIASAEAAARAIVQRFEHLKDQNVAVLERQQDGELRVRETAEAREATRDQTAGTVLGWLLGFANALVGAPSNPIQGATIGEAVGQETGVSSDVGFPDDFLQQLGETLGRGDAALLAAVPHEDSAALVELLSNHGGTAKTFERWNV